MPDSIGRIDRLHLANRPLIGRTDAADVNALVAAHAGR
jgi:hypothetical protein